MRSIDEQSYYTEDSEWIRKTDVYYQVGISDFAQKLYGEITLVILPEINIFFKKGAVVCHLESSKTTSEIFMPVDGKIVAINKTVLEQPDLINQFPYKEGWLFLIEIEDEIQWKELMTAEEYSEYIGELFNKKN